MRRPLQHRRASRGRRLYICLPRQRCIRRNLIRNNAIITTRPFAASTTIPPSPTTYRKKKIRPNCTNNTTPSLGHSGLLTSISFTSPPHNRLFFHRCTTTTHTRGAVSAPVSSGVPPRHPPISTMIMTEWISPLRAKRHLGRYLWCIDS